MAYTAIIATVYAERRFIMRRKYRDCSRTDGDCTVCERVTDRKDCRGKPITNLEWYRRKANLSIKELSERSGVYYRQIQKVELGTSEAGNMTAKNLIAIADAIGVDVKNLI